MAGTHLTFDDCRCALIIAAGVVVEVEEGGVEVTRCCRLHHTRTSVSTVVRLSWMANAKLETLQEGNPEITILDAAGPVIAVLQRSGMPWRVSSVRSTRGSCSTVSSLIIKHPRQPVGPFT